MSEQGQRGTIIKLLRPLDAVSVENSAYPGTPDVNYTGGWIELKWIREWPKRPTTPVRLPHYTQEQKVWARRRIYRGGDVWLILSCREEWLLFRGDVAADILGDSTKEELIEAAERFWPKGLDAGELIQVLEAGI